MSEHLNMAYDEPRDIYIKIRNSDYTILHDWFGNHYKKTKKACEEGYDIAVVKTSPSMMVHWAMQYGTRVEVLEPESLRKALADAVRAMNEKYNGG